MENLVFAFEAVAPSFAIVATGIALKKYGVFSDTFISQGNVLCFKILFPLLVFFNLYDAIEIDFSYIKIILFCIGVIFVSIIILTLMVPVFVKNKKQVSVLIQCIYRGNFMLYGLPFSKSLGGAPSVALATSIMAATLPILNTVGVFVYSAFSQEDSGKRNKKKMILDGMKNPIIWGIILGLIFYIFEIPIPKFLHTAGNDVAKIATPLAFLLLGGQFQFPSIKKNWKLLSAGIFLKLVAMPIIFLWAAVVLLHLEGNRLIPVFIFLAAPTAITNYQMAIQFQADYELAGDFLVYSMLFSPLTMFLFVYFLRSVGLI